MPTFGNPKNIMRVFALAAGQEPVLWTIKTLDRATKPRVPYVYTTKHQHHLPGHKHIHTQQTCHARELFFSHRLSPSPCCAPVTARAFVNPLAKKRNICMGIRLNCIFIKLICFFFILVWININQFLEQEKTHCIPPCKDLVSLGSLLPPP